MIYAPIIIFAFNRLDPLKATVASVLQNTEAAESDLYVFVDGVRPNKEGESAKVEKVQKYVKTITGFKSLTYTFSKENKGLGPSIIAGVSEVISKYGKAIVLEDDLVVQPNFLAYMNQGLTKYESVQKIFSISGYSNKIKIPNDYKADAYVFNDSTSWSWATWKDRWDTIDWVLEPFDQYRKHKKAFNKWNGSDSWGMLNSWHEGRNKSWSIRFNFAQFLQDRPTIAPCYSLVKNDGFDGSGTNCKSWSRFKYSLEPTGTKEFIWPESLEQDTRLTRQAMWYSSIPIRIYSRIMYVVYPIFHK